MGRSPMTKLLVATITAAALVAAHGASAQERYPSRTIKFVVPFVAGSATDTLARLLANHVSKTLGQNIVIENIGGGSGVPAALNVVRSAPDGYTVFITSNTTHASNQSMLKRVPRRRCGFDLSPSLAPSRSRWSAILGAANNMRELLLRQSQSWQAHFRFDLVARGRIDEDRPASTCFMPYRTIRWW